MVDVHTARYKARPRGRWYIVLAVWPCYVCVGVTLVGSLSGRSRFDCVHLICIFPVFLLLVVLIWLSVPVQGIDQK